MNRLILKSALTCPACGHVEVETMSTDACQFFYECVAHRAQADRKGHIDRLSGQASHSRWLPATTAATHGTRSLCE